MPPRKRQGADKMSKLPARVLDPRGRQVRSHLKLAPRVSLEDLKKGPVLFYDNTRLGFCNYHYIFTRIKERLTDLDISNFMDYCETVRGKTTQNLCDYAAMLAKEKPVAAFTALGDMGMSPATTILTIALEKLGIPALYVTAPPGTDLVRAVAFYRSGHLCISSVDIYQGSTAEDVKAQIDLQWENMIDALTLPADKIRARAELHFELDHEAPDPSGLLDIAGRISMSDEDLAEPAAGIQEITVLFDELHIGDGLPIVPPSPRRYAKMVQYCPFPEDHVLAVSIGPTGKDITVSDVAVAAVMAGCKPQYMPILVTAFSAMADKKYNFLQSVTTSHPGGNLVLVSGPLAQELGIHAGQGCIGPGFAANMTIGRAVNLVIINVCRSVPGFADLACVSSQAKLSYCFAEDPTLTPWNTINAEHYDDKTTTVYVLKAEPPHDIIDFLSPTGGDLMDTIVDSCTTLGSNNSYIPGPLLLVLTPDHAKLLSSDGWTKESIRKHINQHAHHPAPMVRNRGLVPVRPKGFEHKHPMPVTRSPQDVEVVVVGGRGGHSSVILPWALHSEGIIRPVILPSGKIPVSIKDFRQR
jgi:hypothetical protein